MGYMITERTACSGGCCLVGVDPSYSAHANDGGEGYRVNYSEQPMFRVKDDSFGGSWPMSTPMITNFDKIPDDETFKL